MNYLAKIIKKRYTCFKIYENMYEWNIVKNDYLKVWKVGETVLSTLWNNKTLMLQINKKFNNLLN